MKNSLIISFTLLLMFTNISVYAQSRIMAKQFAQESTERLMRSISPNTGCNPSTLVIDAEWDNYSNEYIIEMQASWLASKMMFYSKEDFIVRGVLRVNRNGENPSFKVVYRNSAVEGAWTNDEIATVFIGVTMLAAASSN